MPFSIRAGFVLVAGRMTLTGARQPAAPYSIGIVALEEGPTLLTHLRVDPENLAADMQLRVVFMNIGGRTLPCFESAP